MEPADIIEAPSSPSEPDMSIDAGSNPFAIERRETAMSSSGARSDPQRLIHDQRTLAMEADIFRLRTALNTEAIAGQQRIQEVHAHSRTLTRNAMAQQHEVFRDVAQRYEHASAEAAEAAVYKERSNQEAEQHRQLNIYRDILTKVEESVAQRESTLQSEMHFHQEAVKENVSAELADQRRAIVQEAEDALLEERTRLSNVKSEYVQHLTHCQEKAQEGLRSANNTIHCLQHSLNTQEHVQAALNERIQSMQAIIENNDRQLKFEMKQMQNSYTKKLQQAQEKEALSAQELNLQYLVAENTRVQLSHL